MTPIPFCFSCLDPLKEACLAARMSYGLWVTLDHPQARVRTLRRVWRAPAHAERPELWLVAVGVLVRLGASLECCSEGASFWDDLDDPVRTTPLRCLSWVIVEIDALSTTCELKGHSTIWDPPLRSTCSAMQVRAGRLTPGAWSHSHGTRKPSICMLR